MNTAIIIPSRERARWLMSRKNHTLRFVSHLHPILYVRDDDSQLADYKRYADAYKAPLWLQDSRSVRGAAQTYDQLIAWAIGEKIDRLVVLDDDVAFATFQPIDGAKPDFPKATGALLTRLIDLWLSLLTPEMPAASMNSILRRTQPQLLSFSKPLTWCYAYHIPHFAAHPEHRFYKGPEIEAHCDLNISLQLLTDGYMVALLNALIMVTQPNNPGGCSTYRDDECWRLSTEYLLRHYPTIVRPMPKKVEGGQAMRVAWKKAFNYERFRENFGKAAVRHFLDVLRRVEDDYSRIVSEVRHET